MKWRKWATPRLRTGSKRIATTKNVRKEVAIKKSKCSACMCNCIHVLEYVVKLRDGQRGNRFPHLEH